VGGHVPTVPYGFGAYAREVSGFSFIQLSILPNLSVEFITYLIFSLREYRPIRLRALRQAGNRPLGVYLVQQTTSHLLSMQHTSSFGAAPHSRLRCNDVIVTSVTSLLRAVLRYMRSLSSRGPRRVGR